MRNIGDSGTYVVEAQIQILFCGLCIVLGKKVCILNREYRSIFYNREMIYNGMVVRLQGNLLHIRKKRQILSLDKYICVHHWSSDGTISRCS